MHLLLLPQPNWGLSVSVLDRPQLKGLSGAWVGGWGSILDKAGSPDWPSTPEVPSSGAQTRGHPGTPRKSTGRVQRDPWKALPCPPPTAVLGKAAPGVLSGVSVWVR